VAIRRNVLKVFNQTKGDEILDAVVTLVEQTFDSPKDVGKLRRGVRLQEVDEVARKRADIDVWTWRRPNVTQP